MSPSSRTPRSRDRLAGWAAALALAVALTGCRDASRKAQQAEDGKGASPVQAATPSQLSPRLSESAGADRGPRVAAAPLVVRPTSFITIQRMAELEAKRPAQQDRERPVVVWEFPPTLAVERSLSPQPLPEVDAAAQRQQPAIAMVHNPFAQSDRPFAPSIGDQASGARPLAPRTNPWANASPSAHGPESANASTTPTVLGADPTGSSKVSRLATNEALASADDSAVAQQSLPQPTGAILPPTESRTESTASSTAVDAVTLEDEAFEEFDPAREIRSLLDQSSPAATGAPTGARVNSMAIEKLQKSNQLAARGAYFAARAELIEVLQMIAGAKDAIHGSLRRSEALTAGMRALDEAEDFSSFLSNTSGLDEVALAAAGHATPLGKRGALAGLAPWQAADVYLRFAQLNLGAAVAGEPAGSMALHTLGKLYSLLDSDEQGRDPLARRRAFACQQAALLARNDNYLAAHELGVLLAEAGHYHHAERILQQVAAQRLDPVVLRNLARVNQSLGQVELAKRLHAQSVAMTPIQGAGSHVRLLTPEEFVATGEQFPAGAVATTGQSEPTPPTPAAATAVQAAGQPSAESAPWYLR